MTIRTPTDRRSAGASVAGSPIGGIKTTVGQPIEVRDAFGRMLRRVATGPVDPGYDFAVVWACRKEDWDAARAEGREPDATPWPIEDVQTLERVPA